MKGPNYSQVKKTSARPPVVGITPYNPLDPAPNASRTDDNPSHTITEGDLHASEHQTPAAKTSDQAPLTGEGVLDKTETERPLYLTPIETSEKPSSVGHLMYPSRHRQLTDLEYIEQRKRWYIIEQALSEYVERHYGVRAGRRQSKSK